jgi:hypothetical protein
VASTTDIIFTSTENATNDEINQFYFYEVGQEYLLPRINEKFIKILLNLFCKSFMRSSLDKIAVNYERLG